MEWFALAFFCFIVLFAVIDVRSVERRYDGNSWGLPKEPPAPNGDHDKWPE